mgnify:CR=1 FL=1
MITDIKTFGLAFVFGIIPSLLWLWFWLQEDRKNPEPKGALSVVFFMGLVSVIFVLPIQQFIQAHIKDSTVDLLLWATAEELVKFLAVVVVIYRSNLTDEPIDWPIYMITAALGFAALENTLFLIQPLNVGDTVVGLLTGQLRFLGSTLLHTVTSGIVGLAMGASVHLSGFKKNLHLVEGLLLAISLHSIFNFFIIQNDGNDYLKVFAFLWVVTIIVLLIFEKIRRMPA